MKLNLILVFSFHGGELNERYNVGAWLAQNELSVEGVNQFSPKEPLLQNISVPFFQPIYKDMVIVLSLRG